jgi:hypothetical protein
MGNRMQFDKSSSLCSAARRRGRLLRARSSQEIYPTIGFLIARQQTIRQQRAGQLQNTRWLPECGREESAMPTAAAPFEIDDAKSFEARDWSGVSGSILEGVDEILTVTRLGLPKELRRSLACTNIIENVMGTVCRYRFCGSLFCSIAKGAGSHRRAPRVWSRRSALRSAIRLSADLPAESRAFLFQIEGSAGCPVLGEPMLKGGRQYSSASMIVITRLVTDGSAGSGEW